MTKTMLWKQAASTTLAALLAFFIVAGAAIGYEASRPVTYQGPGKVVVDGASHDDTPVVV
jgi:hypothetical protein